MTYLLAPIGGRADVLGAKRGHKPGAGEAATYPPQEPPPRAPIHEYLGQFIDQVFHRLSIRYGQIRPDIALP